MKRQSVLVCGSTGFIGRHITESLRLTNHYQVYATHFQSPPLDIGGIIPVYADLTNQADVDRVTENMDIVVQAAAVTTGSKDVIERPYIHVTNNAVMNSLILRSCYENSVSHHIFFSCSVMYQTKNAYATRRYVSEADFDANAEIFPNYHGVAWTKIYIEKMCEFYSKLGRTRHTVIRHSNIYGPHDKFDLNKSHVLGATITKIVNNTNSRVLVWGSGEEERDFLYISDLVAFVSAVLAKQQEQFQIFNVGSGNVISVGDLNKLVMHLAGRNYQIVFDKTKPTIPTKIGLNCDKAYKALKWEPKVSLRQGLKHTLEWYRENGDDSNDRINQTLTA
jgi:GDP-L-fucose synthase